MKKLFTLLMALVLMSVSIAGAQEDAETSVLDLLVFIIENYETAPDRFMDASESLVPDADLGNDIVEIAFFADVQIIVVAGKDSAGKFCAYMYAYDEYFPFELCGLVAAVYPGLKEYAREGEEIRISWRSPDGTGGSARNAEAAALLAEFFVNMWADE